MLVCSCKAVSERTVKATIAAGARTPADVGRLCSAGTRCGGCWPTLERLLDECAPRRVDEAQPAA